MPRNPNSDIYRQFKMPMRTDIEPISLYEAFGVSDSTSETMQSHIDECFSLYFDTHDCCKDSSSAQRIPYNIVDGLKNSVFSEYEYTIEDSTEAFKKAFIGIDSLREESFQYTCIGGESLLKVIPEDNNFKFIVIPRNSYRVFSRDSKRNIKDIGLIERKTKIYGAEILYYTLLERRYYNETNQIVIEYRLYRSNTDGLSSYNCAPGALVPLNTLQEYAELENYTILDLDINNLGLIPMRTNSVNCVDGSNEPVSFYSAAVKEIKRLYKHEKRIEDEYELTTPRLIVSKDVTQLDRFGRLVKIPKYIESIPLDDESGNPFVIFNPTPHQEQLEARENQILRNIENIISFMRGRWSNVDIDIKTATEIQITSAREAITINNMQKITEEFIRNSIDTIIKFGNEFFNWNITNTPNIQISWGNGILYDEQAEYTRLHEMAVEGFLKPEYLVAWVMNIKSVDKDKREQWLSEIREDFMPSLTNVEAMNTIIG